MDSFSLNSACFLCLTLVRETRGLRGRVRPSSAPVGHGLGASSDPDLPPVFDVGLEVVCGFGLMASLPEPLN